ncbi:lipid II:glycine glycyltransferase FemX [Calderihabitans maritimus]|uniref:Methicillin resistance protein n=1 Tax=Calderihabitans maritimus TaxID=1246530 RepID=A0A1Z5HW61_9FIRM|nr:peptidoglycan bridge formation glycyltransferase FemA/FemB family protein [Calderihabitans maritimus]GAW93776.1 methicillin resistance protein [Calderihabitans maritimus]
MNWKARLITAEERNKYNHFVSRHPKGHILQSYEWGEVKSKTGWKPLRLVVEQEGKIVGAISILMRQVPIGGKTIFYAPRGPVVDLDRQDLLDFLWAEVKKLARQHGAIFLKIDPDVPSQNLEFKEYLIKTGFRPADKEAGFEGIQPKYVFRLDITPSLDELMANFHQKTRYNIRLAIRRGVKVKSECQKEDLRVFYRILLETAERDKFLVRSYDYFAILWDELVERGLANLFMAYYQDEPIAGTLAFIFGDKAWYLYGASSNRYRNVMPNYLLQWTMIQWAKAKGCTMYDFRGVPGDLSEDNPLYGLYRFKKGFGGKYTEFVGEYDLVFSPLYYWLWKTAEPVYSKAVRQLIGLKKKLRG